MRLTMAERIAVTVATAGRDRRSRLYLFRNHHPLPPISSLTARLRAVAGVDIRQPRSRGISPATRSKKVFFRLNIFQRRVHIVKNLPFLYFGNQ